MSAPRRAIAILRVSTDGQDLERQRRDIAAAQRAHNLHIIRTLELEDLSGTRMLTHTDVRRVLADLSKPDTDGVCISAIDRLVRPGELGDLAIFDAFQRAKKKIFTPGQEIDLTTQAGFLTSGIMGVIAGFERQMILARTSAGKEISRQRGGNPNGSATLPRGVAFSKTAGWSYVEPDCSRIRKAYDLLFQRLSWHDIAEQIGGYTYNGVRFSLKNSIWMGVRTYTIGRETPFTIRVIPEAEALISPARWEAAQAIIFEKRTRWAKTRRPPRVLLSGLLRCACGKPCYVRVGGGGNRTYYYCSTRFPGRGPHCGAPSVQQEAADQAIEQIIANELLDAKFLRALLSRQESRQPARHQDAEKIARRRDNLEAERQRLLRMTLQGTCTEADFARESKRIEAETRDLDRLAPAPAPAAFDAAKLAVHIARAFARFDKQPFEERRSIIRRVFREIVLEDGGFTGMTLNGAFLDCVNSLTRSRASSQINTIPDLAITLPQPWIVASIDRRRKNAPIAL